MLKLIYANESSSTAQCAFYLEETKCININNHIVCFKIFNKHMFLYIRDTYKRRDSYKNGIQRLDTYKVSFRMQMQKFRFLRKYYFKAIFVLLHLINFVK